MIILMFLFHFHFSGEAFSLYILFNERVSKMTIKNSITQRVASQISNLDPSFHIMYFIAKKPRKYLVHSRNISF